jgi:putative redox protein
MEARAIWQQRMTFIAQGDSGFPITLGTDASVGGDDDGARPMELIAISLAGCTAMDVISLLTKKRQVVTAFEVQVHAQRATDYPKVITEAVVEYFITGHAIEEAAVVRAIELSATRYCPAQAMLAKVFPIESIYHIFEDEGNGEGQGRLVKSGVYAPVQEPGIN